MNGYDTGEYEDLWKSYFRNTSIDERKNPTLQKKQMPRRYWNNLPELKLK